MTSGSMLIANDTGDKTVLTIFADFASAEPPDNALLFAERALEKEQESRSPVQGHISFLTEWINKFVAQSIATLESQKQEEVQEEETQGEEVIETEGDL